MKLHGWKHAQQRSHVWTLGEDDGGRRQGRARRVGLGVGGESKRCRDVTAIGRSNRLVAFSRGATVAAPAAAL